MARVINEAPAAAPSVLQPPRAHATFHRLAASLLPFAFGAYAGFLFMMTHWPALKLPGPGRPDLVAHLAIFGLWNALFIACGRFGPRLSIVNIAICTMIASVYAAIDESLQHIPGLNRVPALDDFGANVAGILLAGVFAVMLSRLAGPRNDRDG